MSVICRLIHGCPLNHDVSDETFKVVDGTYLIGFRFTCAISPWSKWTRVEVEAKLLLVLLGRLLGKLKVALEEIVVATP